MYCLVLFLALAIISKQTECTATNRRNPTFLEDDRIIIRVSQHGKDTDSCRNNGSLPCETIAFALGKANLDSTTILLSKGLHVLPSKVTVNNVKDFKLEGDARATVVKCVTKYAGLAFVKSSNLRFYGFSMQGCGAEHNSTSVIKGRPIFIYSSLYLKECINVATENVKVQKSNGTGAVFYDVGGNVTFTNVSFESNLERRYYLDPETGKSKMAPIYEPGLASGGGLYVEFTCANKTLSSTVFNSNSSYTFQNCNFTNNIAEYEYSYPSSPDEPNNFVSFGRGGGFSLMSRGSAAYNKFVFKTCTFENNSALWGAALFAEFHEKSGNNSILVQGCSFSKNTASYGGGAIRTGLASDHSLGFNDIVLQNCQFSSNKAHVGGAYSQYRELKDSMKQEVTVFQNCNFFENEAVLGLAIHMSVSEFKVIDTNFSNNMVSDYYESTSGKGAVYLYTSNMILLQNNIFRNNFWSAVVFEFSTVEIYDNAQFINNTGINGGAFALYGESWVILREKSRVLFKENTATRLGGALYVKTPGPPMAPMNTTEFMVYKCAIVFGDEVGHLKTFDTKVRFVNNTAPQAAGSSIFISTLNWCRQYGERKYNNTALQWNTTLFYERKDHEPSIITNPVIIETHQQDWVNHSPSMAFRPRLVLRDELWNNVSGTVKVTITSKSKGRNSVKLTGSDVFAVRGILPAISLSGKENSIFSIKIETVMGVTIRSEIKDVALAKCRLGYFQQRNAPSCKCLSSLGVVRGVTHCQSNNVYILRGRWGDPKGQNKDFAKHHCPRKYCRTCKEEKEGDGIECLYNQRKQCETNRQWDSVLCGRCKSGYSIKLGNEDCAICENTSLFWLVAWLAALTLFVFVIMLLNLNDYFTYLNAYLYSYQVLPLLLVGNHYIDPFISFVMGLTNFSGTGGNIGVCLWDGMTDIHKLALNYITPVYIILCTCLIGFISFHCRSCPFNKQTTLRALALLSIFSYADFTRITFELLHSVDVRGKKVLYLQGDVGFFSLEHAPYAICALLMLVVVVLLFPLVLIFFHWFLAKPKLVKLKGIVDSFQEPFKEGYERWAAFYLIARCVLLVLAVFLDEGTVKDTLLAICCEVILIIFLVMKPYENDMMNYFDIFLLANITFVGTINVGLDAVTEKEKRRAMQIAATVLTYVPLMCIILQFMNWLRKKLKEFVEKKRRGSEGSK
eukprot:Seg2167.4 transcript_id=Seg2167.4/GoldUCD/mRNA.D3Y31 product="hypothetical protein" protein_id=Seg2167.4/GoldUCD/D3Y31